MTLTNKSMVLDVTVGSIKYGSELNVPSYFLSGGYQMPHQSQIYAFGLTLPTPPVNAGIGALAATEPVDVKKINYGHVSHKKTLHYYKPAETKWVEASDQVQGAGAPRRESTDNFYYED